MQFLTEHLEWIYFLTFLALSATILAPWPRRLGRIPNVILSATSIVSVLAIAWVLNRDLVLHINALSDSLTELSPTLSDELASLLPDQADFSGLWFHLLAALAFLFAYAAFRSLAIIVAWLLAIIYWPVRWLLERIGLIYSRSTPHVLLAPASTEFFSGGLLAGLLLIGLAYASLGFLQFNAAVNWYFPALFWVAGWIALIELGSMLEIDRRHGSGGLPDAATTLIGTDSQSQRFVQLGEIFDKMRADYSEQLLLATSPDDSGTVESGISAGREQDAAGKVANNMQAALKDYQRGCDLAFTEALSEAHIELIGDVLLSARNFGREALILTPPGVAETVEATLLRRFGAQYIRDSYSMHYWAVSGKPSRHIDFHFCDYDSFDYFLAHYQGFENLGLVCALEIHKADLGELRFAFQRLWERADSRIVPKIFHSTDFYNAEPSIRFVSKTRNLVEHHLTTNTSNDKFLLVWDRPDIDNRLSERVHINSTDPVDAAILVAKDVFQQFGLPTTWLDEPQRFDKDVHESLRSHNDISWLTHCDNRINIDQHAHIVATEDLNNLSFAKEDTANFRRHHTYLHHIFSSNYLLRDAMAAVTKVEGHFWSPVMPNVAGDLQNLAHQCGQELAGHCFSQATLENLLGLFVQQDLLKTLRITPSKPGLQRLFSVCYGLKDIDITHQCLADGSFVYGFSHVIPVPHLITVRDSSGTDVGVCSRNDRGLLYAKNTNIFLRGVNYRVTDINHEAIIVTQSEAVQDRRRKFLFARDYSVEYTEGSVGHVDFTVGMTGVQLDRRLANFTRETVGFLNAAESMHLQEDTKYHRLGAGETPAVSRRYKNCLHLKLSRADVSLDNVAAAEFTLAALVQDSLYSFFPEQASHVVVLPTRREARPDGNYSNAALVQFLYPQLVKHDHLDQQSQASQQASSYLEIVVLEDSDGDLGVVSTLFQERSKILQVVTLYLNWYIENRPLDGYHHFGADSLYRSFDYTGLAAFLSDFVVRPPRAGRATRKASPPLASTVLKVGICDFCSAELGSGYDLLDDGRCRCLTCSKDALVSLDDFRDHLAKVIDRMESTYGVSLRRDISAVFASAAEIAQATRIPFIPTQRFDPRAVGLAIGRGDDFSILIESGAPLLDSLLTIAHELTHIWQYEHLSRKQLNDIEIAEGQARFIEIDFARLIGRAERADKLEKEMVNGSDVYSLGYRKILSQLQGRTRAEYFKQFSLC